MILTARVCFPSARRLRDAIEEYTGRKLGITSEASRLRNSALHIRYGNMQAANKETQYNSRDAIAILSSKKQFSNLLVRGGYLAPEFVNNRNPEEWEYPILVRTSLRLHGGAGIYPCLTEDDLKRFWKQGSHWCRYHDTTSEFRAHVIKKGDGDVQIVRMLKKVPRNEEVLEKKIQIRHLNDYQFSLRVEPEEKYPKMCKEIKEVAELLPGKFFALDIGWSGNQSRPFFFESNTAPGLDSQSSLVYARFFRDEGVI